MGEYRLSQSATDDLIAIAQYGDENFGVVQSNRYRDQLKQRCSVLAEQPQLYPTVDYIRPGYHRSVCGAFDLLPRRRAGRGDNAYFETSRPKQSALGNAAFKALH